LPPEPTLSCVCSNRPLSGLPTKLIPYRISYY
jgi:hypothetical protein